MKSISIPYLNLRTGAMPRKSLTPLEKLDKVITYLNENLIRPVHTLAEIGEGLKNEKAEIENSELLLILNKLKQDKFIEIENREIKYLTAPDTEEIITIELYFSITFEGRLFNQEGGYTRKKEKEDVEINRLKTLEQNERRQAKGLVFLQIIIAIGTAIASFYYILEILKDYSHKRHTQELPIIIYNLFS